MVKMGLFGVIGVSPFHHQKDPEKKTVNTAVSIFFLFHPLPSYPFFKFLMNKKKKLSYFKIILKTSFFDMFENTMSPKHQKKWQTRQWDHLCVN